MGSLPINWRLCVLEFIFVVLFLWVVWIWSSRLKLSLSCPSSWIYALLPCALATFLSASLQLPLCAFTALTVWVLGALYAIQPTLSLICCGRTFYRQQSAFFLFNRELLCFNVGVFVLSLRADSSLLLCTHGDFFSDFCEHCGWTMCKETCAFSLGFVVCLRQFQFGRGQQLHDRMFISMAS